MNETAVRERAPDADSASIDTRVPAFVRSLTFSDLPADVVRQARRCLLDLIGVAAGGIRTPAAAIVNRLVTREMVSVASQARLLFDGRRASRAGAAFAGASTIDALDGHDGHVLTKGHAGVAALPALLAVIDGGAACDDREFIACLVLGYEIGTRAGVALHASVPDYHCSGAWNALACAAIVGRLLRQDERTLRQALGIAEYFGPRGQILRVCSYPSMLKDGSGWGAHTGVTSALLAEDGFTGAPAVTIEDDATREHWSDFGTRWRIREQYFKPYPVCRWAQPAIEAALALKRMHRFGVDDIVGVTIESFREAIDLGSRCRYPTTTEDAQYSLPYATAAALVYDRVSAEEVDARAVGDPRIAQLLDVIVLSEEPDFSRRFPAERYARVKITLRNGRELSSEPMAPRGNPDSPLDDTELADKYRALAEPVLGTRRTARIAEIVASLGDGDRALSALIDDLLSPPTPIQ
jgi:2-methylcitrate dehydratase PrpD